MPKEHSLGDLQHAIMRVLWEQGELPVADVHEALLEERGLALTTIATMLSKICLLYTSPSPRDRG